MGKEGEALDFGNSDRRRRAADWTLEVHQAALRTVSSRERSRDCVEYRVEKVKEEINHWQLVDWGSEMGVLVRAWAAERDGERSRQAFQNGPASVRTGV